MNSFDRERLRIQRAKMLYPPGTRIVLGEMSDPYAPVPPGTRGTVKFVDDMGTIHPQWDNGRTLGLIFGEDSASSHRRNWRKNPRPPKKRRKPTKHRTKEEWDSECEA